MSIDAFRSRIAVRLWLGAFGTVLALAFVHDEWTAHDDALDRMQQLEEELEEKKDTLAHHDALAAELAQMRPQLAEVERRLPDALDPAALEQALRATATGAGVELDEVRFGKSEVKEFYASLPASIHVHGPIEKLQKFAARVQRDDAPFRQIKWLQIKPDPEAKTFRAAMVATYYRYAADGK